MGTARGGTRILMCLFIWEDTQTHAQTHTSVDHLHDVFPSPPPKPSKLTLDLGLTPTKKPILTTGLKAQTGLDHRSCEDQKNVLTSQTYTHFSCRMKTLIFSMYHKTNKYRHAQIHTEKKMKSKLHLLWRGGAYM